jgi:glutamate formiminotransferase
MLLCVVNLSEGRDGATLSRLTAAAGRSLLDVHTDADHHRSVWTLAGPSVEDAARALAREAVATLDLRTHSGVHPRTGVVDVVPWVHLTPHAAPGEATAPGGAGRRLGPGPIGPAVTARGRFAAWIATELGVPAVCYGPAAPAAPPVPAVPGRTLPELRRRLWVDLAPDVGPDRPHPSAGAVAVGARPALVAYNLWLAEPDLALARRVAAEIRGPGLRTLGLAVGNDVQVSCNLIDPWAVGPGAAFDAVASRAAVARAELVGLVPAAVLAAEPPRRWRELDLDPGRTIEARLQQAGLDGGRPV